MARIGRNVTFDGSRESITDKLTKGITFLGLLDINFGFVDDNTINIYGEADDLTALRDLVVEKGFTFTINGAAPTEPTGDTEPGPTQDELDAQQFFRDAFNAEMAAMETAILAAIKVRYDLANTTAIAFEDVPKSDIKHLRQRI